MKSTFLPHKKIPRKTKESNKINKEASWLYAELKLHISFQVSFVAYLKLSDETWNEMCYLKLLQLETFQTHHKGCLFETFRWDLKKDVLFETFVTCQPRTGVGYLKFSDETWKQDVLFETFQTIQTHHRVCLYETFILDLKQDVLFETFEKFETWNFSNMSLELLICNFQMTLEKRCAIWNLWNFSNFSNPSQGLLIWNFSWGLKWDVLFETFET